MKRSAPLFYLLTACLLLMAFQQVTKQDLIQEKVDERIGNYVRLMRQKCEERVLERATTIVDSILIEQAKMRKDSLGKLPKPDRPTAPNIKSSLDSTPVAPLFSLEDSLKTDTTQLDTIR
jgi:hypothetical protein